MNRFHLGWLLNSPLLLALLLLGCDPTEEPVSEEQSSVVVTSIFPLGDLVDRLVEGVRVHVVLPPGASPATFDITPRQVVDLGDARLFVMVGGGLDEWTARLSEVTGGRSKILRVSEGIELLADEEAHGPEEGHHHAAGNPHIWLDPVLIRDRIVPRLSEALAQAFPEKSESIRNRGEVLSDSLTALDQEIRTILAPAKGRAFIATHSAWTYFARRYGLEEVGVVHRSPGHEPGSRDVARLISLAREHDVRCLFTEPQLGDMAAKALASELSLPTLMLDPLGGPEMDGREGYFELLRFNSRQFARGLGEGTEA